MKIVLVGEILTVGGFPPTVRLDLVVGDTSRDCIVPVDEEMAQLCAQHLYEEVTLRITIGPIQDEGGDEEPAP